MCYTLEDTVGVGSRKFGSMAQAHRSDMLTISDFYSQDVDRDTVFVLEYPTSHPDLRNDERFFRNTTKYLLDDVSLKADYNNYHVEIPQRGMSVFGDKARVYADDVRPDARLEEHWDRKLGRRGKLRYADLGEDGVPHVVLFPMEVLPRELHAIDPDVHYRVHSKAFIPTVACPQPEVLHSLRLPAVLKACRAAGSEGTWKIRTQKEYNNRMSWLKEHLPWADLLLTKWIQDVTIEHCCQVYINKKGEMTWIGSTEELFDGNGFWCGALCDTENEEDIKKSHLAVVEPVAKALHDQGFFGLCGLDILQDSTNELYLVDINPRVCGSSSILLASRMMKRRRGWSWGYLKADCTSQKPFHEILQSAEQDVTSGEVCILSGSQADGTTRFQAAFFSRSKQSALDLSDQFLSNIIIRN